MHPAIQQTSRGTFAATIPTVETARVHSVVNYVLVLERHNVSVCCVHGGLRLEADDPGIVFSAMVSAERIGLVRVLRPFVAVGET